MICSKCRRSGSTIVKIAVISRGTEQTKIRLVHQCNRCGTLHQQEIGVLELDAMNRAYQEFIEMFGV